MTTATDTKALVERIAAIRARLSEATDGPWQVYVESVPDQEAAMAELCRLVAGTPSFSGIVAMLTAPNGLSPGITGCGATSLKNAEFIAHAREDVPFLLDALEALSCSASSETPQPDVPWDEELDDIAPIGDGELLPQRVHDVLVCNTAYAQQCGDPLAPERLRLLSTLVEWVKSIAPWECALLRDRPAVASSETHEEPPDERLERVREILMSCQQTYDVPGSGIGWYLVSRDKMKAILKELAQSSPVPHEAKKEQ